MKKQLLFLALITSNVSLSASDDNSKPDKHFYIIVAPGQWAHLKNLPQSGFLHRPHTKDLFSPDFTRYSLSEEDVQQIFFPPTSCDEKTPFSYYTQCDQAGSCFPKGMAVLLTKEDLIPFLEEIKAPHKTVTLLHVAAKILIKQGKIIPQYPHVTHGRICQVYNHSLGKASIPLKALSEVIVAEEELQSTEGHYSKALVLALIRK